MQPFPPIQPYATHHLPVGNGHTLYIEESGNPSGLPVLRIHGGPGSASKAEHRQTFNPKKFRIILTDQRACGLSTATHPLKANTTQHLLTDLETIRTHLGIKQWHAVFATSWGSTLALLYAQAHPKTVQRLVLSAIFLANADALTWLTHPHGAAQLFPIEYQAVAKLLGHPKPAQFYPKLYQALTSPNRHQAHTVAQAFGLYDAVTMEPAPDHALIRAELATNPEQLVQKMSLFAYYAKHKCFLTPNQILHHAPRITHIPTTILHGSLDLCCPPAGATQLHTALPKSTLQFIPLCGHRSTDTMKSAQLQAIHHP